MSLIAQNKAEQVLYACRKRGFMIATAESCTGGLIIACLTDVAGCSDVVDCGFITYSNDAKNTLVGVQCELIKTYGAVSKPVAMAMAEGALNHSRANIAVSVTGIAGPGGGSDEKPVGLVHMAVAVKGQKTHHYEARFGDIGRDRVRRATVERALDFIIETLNQNN